MAIQPRIAAAGERQLGEQRLDRRGLAPCRTQYVEAHHVARALPDRIEGSLAIKPWQRALLDIAVAAQHFHRLGHHRRCAFAQPILQCRRRHARKRPLGLARIGFESPSEPQCQCNRGFRFDGEIGEHVLHQRRFDESFAECRTVRGMVNGLRGGAAHQPAAADDAVEASVLHHLDDHRYAASLVA